MVLTGIQESWTGLSTRARVGLVVCLAGVIILAVLMSYWALRVRYQVLFADLQEQDAAAVVGKLDGLKVPYRLSAAGNAILVREDSVYETRLKLMGDGLPISGGVGFEIFDKSDFGMTQYAQRINFQRALQGELARTIMALDEVKFARVHLVLPQSSIFKRQKEKTTASTTLILNPGDRLDEEQIAGIQRLIAAAVPGLESPMVIITDQRGVVLSDNDEPENKFATASGQLELKLKVEDYLTKKVVSILDRALGPGKAMVSMDVTLDLDQVKTTLEDVIPIAHSKGVPTGAISKKRYSVQRQPTSPLVKVAGTQAQYSDGADRPARTTSEVEYKLGRKVEQVVRAPGSIRRLSVGVIVPGDLQELELKKIHDVVAMAVGFTADRGDGIVIHSLPAADMPLKVDAEMTARSIDEENALAEEMKATAETGIESYEELEQQHTAEQTTGTFEQVKAWLARTYRKAEQVLVKDPLITGIGAAGILIVIILTVLSLHAAKSKQDMRGRNKELSLQERQAILAQLREWMGLNDENLAGERKA